MQRFYRRLSPRARSYAASRPFLRYEFRFVCSYCGIHESEYGAFEIDHFRPKKKFPQLTNSYSNLYYSCRPCNRVKQDFWPSSDDEAAGRRFVDPCEESLLGTHADLLSSGALKAKTAAGGFTIGHLFLNRSQLSRWRRKRRQEVERHYETVEKCKQTLAVFDEMLQAAESGSTRLAADSVARLRSLRADYEKQLEELLQYFLPVLKPLDED